MSKRIKWYYSPPSMVIMGALPEEVEDRGDVAVPTQQSDGCFSYVLWPQGALYSSEQEALSKAIEFHQGIADDATGRVRRLTKRLAETVRKA